MCSCKGNKEYELTVTMEGWLLYTKWLTKASSGWWHFAEVLRNEKGPGKKIMHGTCSERMHSRRISIPKLSEACAKWTRNDIRWEIVYKNAGIHSNTILRCLSAFHSLEWKTTQGSWSTKLQVPWTDRNNEELVESQQFVHLSLNINLTSDSVG